MKRPLRLTLLLLLVVALGGGAYWWYERTYTKDPLAGIITAEAVAGDIEQAVLATGELRPVKLVAVGAQVSGRLTALGVTVGQSVKQGDRIAEIDSVPQQNALKTTEAALAAARAQRVEKQATLAYAEASLTREAATLGQHASSRDAYEVKDATVKTTRAQIAALDAEIAQAEVAVDVARVNLGYTRITAPIDGTVLLVVTQQGQTVNASQSAPTIVVLGQIDRMTVQAEISEADVTRVKPGQSVYFTILGDPTKRWETTLQSIDPAPDELRSDSAITTSASSVSSSTSSSASSAIYYYGRFDVPNPDGLLKTYMTAEVHIVLGAVKNAVTIPFSALSAPEPDGKRTVYVVDAQGNITSRAVDAGLDDKVRVEIRSGLQLGEKVIASRASGNFVKTMTISPPMGM